MNKNNRLNQSGLTLIELLVTITLTSLIVIAATSILVKGMGHYNTVKTENSLRDEADVIMVKLYRDLYTSKISEIAEIKHENPLADGTFSDNYLLYNEITLPDGRKVKKKTGFINDKLYIRDEEYSFQNEKIQLNTSTKKSSITESSEGVYKINLVLYMTDKKKSMEFVTEVSIINDKERTK